MKSHRLESVSCMEHVRHQLKASDQAMVRFLYFCMVDCSMIYALDIHVYLGKEIDCLSVLVGD